jgi:sugar lactone lactonase YvrE
VTSGPNGAIYVVDAASNTLDRVGPNGSVTVVAFFPPEPASSPVPGEDSTPTCAAQGPDGAIYVGTLDLLANLEGSHQGYSHVYRVDPNASDPRHAAVVWASGLTTITSCTFDDSGNFWATEMFYNNAGGPPGDVVRIPFSHPSTITHIGNGSLPLPGGIAQGPNGDMFVTVNSTGSTTADGAVERLSQH